MSSKCAKWLQTIVIFESDVTHHRLKRKYVPGFCVEFEAIVEDGTKGIVVAAGKL